MGRVYVMSDETDKIKAKLEKNEIEGLSLVHKPLDQDGKPSYWPYAVTDGTNYGFFEKKNILFWGQNDENHILLTLEKHGFRVIEVF
jgi:hypothetical protein